IFTLIGIILVLHYFTHYHFAVRHAVYRMLFYLPLVLGSFWFGFKGAMGVSIAVILFYAPFLFSTWQGISHDFEKLIEGTLFVFIALVLGYLSEKERKEETARYQAERLASIGRAVSEIAHDMKSPLMAIGGFTSQVSRKLSAKDPNRKKLDLVVNETSRLESMVKEMLDFSRPVQLQTRMENLNRLAEECIEISAPVAEDHGVKIKTEFDPELPSQSLDEYRIKQVIMNLITNAIQASPPGKTVWVRTRKGKHEAALDLSDSGCGIKEEDQEKIFEPFFSTKKEGTGLGLAIVKKIAEAHGGEISLYSNPEEGVTFSVRLPAEK
ncbi:MAG: sensor histidine kinase, partial [Thermodesulfobacteriota bacterium]